MSNVYEKISLVQGDLATAGIGKDNYNDHGRYKFRGIDAVYNALAPLLAKHKLVIIPSAKKAKRTSAHTSQGKPTNHWSVDVQYTLVDAESPEHIHTCNFAGEAYDTSDKGLNKALTSAYKYMVFELFCIPIEGHDDADASHHQTSGGTAVLSDEMAAEVVKLCLESNTEVEKFAEWLGYPTVRQIPFTEYGRAVSALRQKISKLAEEYAKQESLTAQSIAADQTAE